MKEDKYLKLRELLKVKKITYDEFGKSIGISRPTITNWFQGKSKIDIDLIEIIAERLGVPVTYFFTDSNVKNLSSQTYNKTEKLLEDLIEEKNERIKLLEDKNKLLEEKITLLNEVKKTVVTNAGCVDVAG